ncbi:hypothetical protein [uncultured Microbulbifer sp.]|uniref:hypothetical protein n=1 Tax=uncultured Microbulbifer sp. TaxID=348147 RepID=UPI002605C47C|nr:hypothetical protein [uncultured Microbulbifer sp.]
MSTLLQEKELKAWLNCARRGDLVRLLDEAKIPYVIGIGGCISTSQGAIDGALLKSAETQDSISEWDSVRVGG